MRIPLRQSQINHLFKVVAVNPKTMNGISEWADHKSWLECMTYKQVSRPMGVLPVLLKSSCLEN